MEVTVITPQPWSISESFLKIFNETYLENTLSVFNQVGSSNFYLMDYFNKKIIVDSPSSLILCGHPKEIIEKEGFDFLKRIVVKKEAKRINLIDEKVYNFFFSYPKDELGNLVLSYNFTALTAKNKKMVLHYNVKPYKLCKNGNVWLSLCHVWASAGDKLEIPTITNKKTGEQYRFINNKFTLIEAKSITNEEIIILEWLIKDLPDKQMSELFKIPLHNFKRKKRALFQKLEVGTSAGAIHKAHLMGLI